MRSPRGMDSWGEPLSGRDLAAFVAAVEAGTVQGAAEALDLTQSAATKRIQALERRVGTPLLVRGRAGVRPTEAGRVLYPEARQALDALQRAGEVVLGERRAGALLRLSASHTIGEFLLPGWLVAFRAGDRELRVQVDVVNSQGVIAAVRGGGADIGFVEGLDPLDGLASLTLVRDEIVAVVAPSHPWARRRSIAAGALAGEAYLTREQGSGTRAVADRALARHGTELAPALEAASSQSLKRAVLDGGFTLLSRLAVEAEERAGALRTLRVADVDLGRELRAIRRRRAQASGPAHRFWAWLERRAAGA